MGTGLCLPPLGLWEEEEVINSSMYLDHVDTWLRYIDDVFMVWVSSLDGLHMFTEQRNQNKRNIHLTYTCDQTQNFHFGPMDNGGEGVVTYPHVP